VSIVLTAPESQASALLVHWTRSTRGEVWIVATGGPWDGFRDAVVAALPQMLDQLAAGIGHTLKPDDATRVAPSYGPTSTAPVSPT
jgi:hypothetical protein